MLSEAAAAGAAAAENAGKLEADAEKAPDPDNDFHETGEEEAQVEEDQEVSWVSVQSSILSK